MSNKNCPKCGSLPSNGFADWDCGSSMIGNRHQQTPVCQSIESGALRREGSVMVEDLVNHPPHYKAGGVEAIEVIEAFELGYRLGNVVKYVLRSGRKGDSEHQDLLKAKWYLEREIKAKNQLKTAGN